MAIRSEVTLDTTKAKGEARRASNEIAKSMSAAASGGIGGSGGGGFLKGGAGGFFSGAESGLTKLTSAISLARASWAGLSSVINNADAMNDLRDGVGSVLPAAADLNAEMEKLRELSESPGLEFESVAKAHETFLSLGQSSEVSMNNIREIGNALQLSGKDPKMLGSIVESLSKMSDKGEANVKMLHGLVGEVGVFREVFKKGFGVESLQELENLHLSGQQFISQFSTGLRSLGTAEKDAADKLGDFSDRAKQMGATFVNNAAEVADSIGTTIGIVAAEIVGAESTARELAGGSKNGRQRSDESASDKAAREEAALAARKARLSILDDEIDQQRQLSLSKQEEAELMREIGSATNEESKKLRVSLLHQEEKTDALDLEIRKRKELADLMKVQGMSEKEATAYLEKQVESTRAISDNQNRIAAAAKAKAAAETVGKSERARSIAEARSHGHLGKAMRLQEKMDTEEKQKEYERLGLDPAAARKNAQADMRVKKDQEVRDRTGRSAIHGIEVERNDKGISSSRPSDVSFGRLEGRPRTADTLLPKFATTQLSDDERSAMRSQPATPQKADPELLKKMDTLIESFNEAQKRENAKPLSAA